LVQDKEYFARKAVLYRYGNTAKDETDAAGNVTQSGFREWTDDRFNPDAARNTRDGHYSMFNIFSDINMEEGRAVMMRNAIRAGITNIVERERTENIRAGRIVEEQGLDEDFRQRRTKARQVADVEYGEMWAFKETYWTGIAAYNDISAIAFDKWGQELNTGNYRKRQAKGRGPFGIEDTVYGINRLGLNFWHGLKVRAEGGRDFDQTLIQAIQGGDGWDIKLDGDIKDFDFQGNAQKQYMADHILTSYKLAGFLIDKHGMNFDQFLKYDYRGKLVIDEDKANEIIKDTVWHDLRYAFDQRGFLFDNPIRTWLRDDNGGLHFENKTLKEHMFDDEVLEIRRKMFERADLPETNHNFSSRVREERDNNAFARGVLAYLVAKELKWHMKDHPGTVKYTLHEVDMMRKFFDSWKLDIKKDEKGNVVIDEPFFSEDEFFEIEKTGNAEENKLRRNLILSLFAMFIVGTLWGSIKESRKALSDAVK
jgi:hypothetical protein